MALTNYPKVNVQEERQWPLAAFIDLSIANYGAGNGFTIVVPPGAFLLSMGAFVNAAFNAGTTNTLTVVDNASTPVTFANAVTIGALGPVAFVTPVQYYPNGATITVSAAQTGTAATAGSAFFYMSYVINGRANEVAGTA
jgi:hypothetical protein